MTYVRKTKWHPLGPPRVRMDSAGVQKLQHRMTMAYWKEATSTSSARVFAWQERQKCSAALLEEAKYRA